MLLVLFIVGCDKEQTNTENRFTGVSTKAKAGKVNVCHKGEVININGNAVSAHENHGDAVDIDGDGLVDIENACSATDCDDNYFNDPYAKEICDNSIHDNCNGEVDEGCIIPFVTICEQDWMLKNLDVDTYRDGSPITHAQTDVEWLEAGAAGTGAWCYYENNTSNGPIYGKLYNYYAVIDPRGLAPEGWHVSYGPDFNQLNDCLESDNGNDRGGQMKSIGTIEEGTGLWHSPNTSATNSSGFTGLPGGSRQDDGTFAGIGDLGAWWITTEENTYEAGGFALSAEINQLYAEGSVTYGATYGASGISVRCVRDY